MSTNNDDQASEGRFLHFDGEYRLIRRLGVGGFGEVWLCEAPGAIEVAIKLIYRPISHHDAVREQQSLEIIRNLRHPFLLQTQTFFQQDDRLYIIMELAENSLRDRANQCQKEMLSGIPVFELLQYFRESAEALDFLHKRCVIHGDIKPENILLLERHAKVADFGLIRVIQDSQGQVSVSGSGTPLYTPPEVWRGKMSPRSDQYSLALTYAEMRLCRHIWNATDLMQIMLAHTQETPYLGPLAQDEQNVLLKALAKNPEDRYPTCSSFIQSLEQVLRREIDMAGTSGEKTTAVLGSLHEEVIVPPTRSIISSGQTLHVGSSLRTLASTFGRCFRGAGALAARILTQLFSVV